MSSIIDPALIAVALSLGFLGSSHCIGMCGGISAALSINQQSNGKLQQLAYLLGFNSGRILSYALAAIAIGFIGQLLGNYHQNLALGMRIAAGLLLILMGLYVAGINQWLTKLEQKGQFIWRRIQPLTKNLLPAKNLPASVLLGALWGWLPCGLVYSSLGWASLNSQSWWQAALLMAAFGLGTLPMMLATGFAAQRLQAFLQQKNIRLVLGVFILGFGLWTIIGILPHAGGHSDHGAHSGHANHSQQMNHNASTASESQKNDKGEAMHQHHHH